MKWAGVAIACLATAVACTAPNSLSTAGSVAEAVDALRVAESFRSHDTRHFAVVLRSASAEQVFRELAMSEKPVPQLWGMCGLYLTNPPFYQGPLSIFRRKQAGQDIPFIQGICLVHPGTRSSESLADDIDSGELPRLVLEQVWFLEHPR